MNRARMEVSVKIAPLVNRTFALAQNGIAIMSYAGLLLHFSGVAVAILAIAGLPAFEVLGRALLRVPAAEPDRRMLRISRSLAREDHAKEVKLFDSLPGHVADRCPGGSTTRSAS